MDLKWSICVLDHIWSDKMMRSQTIISQSKLVYILVTYCYMLLQLLLQLVLSSSRYPSLCYVWLCQWPYYFNAIKILYIKSINTVDISTHASVFIFSLLFNGQTENERTCYCSLECFWYNNIHNILYIHLLYILSCLRLWINHINNNVSWPHNWHTKAEKEKTAVSI